MISHVPEGEAEIESIKAEIESVKAEIEGVMV